MSPLASHHHAASESSLGVQRYLWPSRIFPIWLVSKSKIRALFWAFCTVRYIDYKVVGYNV